MTEINENEKKAVERISQIFDNRVSFEDALDLFEKLGSKKWHFVRACILYEIASNCKTCERNKELKQDIQIAFLCSSVEAISGTRAYTIFKDWLISEKLRDLSMKRERQVQRVLNRAYQEYLDTEPYREGAFYNFRKFLTENCPKELRKGPIEIFDDKIRKNRQATFEESINYVYAKFRSLFIHRGLGRATVHVPKDLENAICLGFDILDVYRGKGYTIDSMSVSIWFENVVKESLWHHLVHKN